MRYPGVMSEPLTIQCAHDGVNLGRFGDGELKLALGRDCKSQRAEPALQRMLREILDRPRPGFLACIPNIGGQNSPKEGFWAAYRGPKYAGLYRLSTIYGSSFVSRPDSSPTEMGPVYFRRVADLWRNQDIVVVGGSGKSMKAADFEGANSVFEVECPRQHAFSVFPELLESLKGERRRVFLCCGATATVLAYELTRYGVHAIDLGHFGMFLRKQRAGEALSVTDEDRAAP